MESISFLPFLLIILAILFGLTGLILLILGLVHSKKALWISGSGGLIVAIVFVMIGIIGIIRPTISNIAHGINKFDLRNRHLNNVFSNKPDYLGYPVDTSFTEPISGFIDDSENSPVFIKVFPKKDLISNGIYIQNIVKSGYENNAQNAISLYINFEKSYSGNMVLTAYNEDRTELGKSEIIINNKNGIISNIDFPFPADVNFSTIKYCELTLN